MGTSLTGTTPQDTYDSLIKVTDNGPISGTAKYLSDGLGNDSSLALSTGFVGIGNIPSNAYDGYKLQVGSIADAQTFISIGNSSTGLGPLNGLVIGCDSTGADIYQREDQPLRLHTNGSERMRITSAGNVGIGTSSPNSKLNVVGDGATNGLTIKSAGNGGTFPFRVTWTSGTDGEFFCINDSGNVGIGTSSPANTLDVAGTGRIKSSLADYLLTIENIKDDSQGLLVRATDNDAVPILKLQSSVGATSETWIDRFVVNKNGNVGIGTTAPADLLHARRLGNGNVVIVASDQTNSQVNIGVGVVTGGFPFIGTNTDTNALQVGTRANADMIFLHNSTELGRITSNGLTFNGDTSSNNALSDYEQGTFTPTIAFGGAAVGVTYFDNAGVYTKIGRQVTCTIYLALTNVGSSTGAVTLTGLPFANGNVNRGSQSAAAIRFDNITYVGSLCVTLPNGQTALTFQQVTEAGTDSVLSNANFNGSSEMSITLTYFV